MVEKEVRRGQVQIWKEKCILLAFFSMITMMVKMMSFRNQIRSGRQGGAKRPGPDLEGKMNIISYFDDNNDGEDDEH